MEPSLKVRDICWLQLQRTELSDTPENWLTWEKLDCFLWWESNLVPLKLLWPFSAKLSKSARDTILRLYPIGRRGLLGLRTSLGHDQKAFTPRRSLMFCPQILISTRGVSGNIPMDAANFLVSCTDTLP